MSGSGEGAGAPLRRMVAEQQIGQALLRLGLSFADCSGLVRYEPEVETACWWRDQRSGGEAILVGALVARQDVECIEMVLRHELLHRSLYHGMGERYDQPELANLTLDVCINRLLYEAYPPQMRRTCEVMYDERSRASAVALADCTADPGRLDPELAELWQEIWSRRPDGGFGPLDPSSLYYKLLRLRESLPDAFAELAAGSFGRSGQRGSGRGAGAPAGEAVCPAPAAVSPQVGRAIDTVLAALRAQLPGGSDLGRRLSELSVSPVRIGTSQIEDFVRSIRVRRVADEVARKVTEPFARGTRVQPYPLLPSRLGLFYRVSGLDRLFRLHWNREDRHGGARLALGIYVDVSGSMADKLPLVATIVGAVQEIPLRLRVFDVEVREADPAELARGRFKGGGGTDFDAPLLDMLEAPDLGAAVLLTDGEASVSDEVGRRLRASRRPLYVVYLLDGPARGAALSPLDRYATEALRLQVPG